MSPPPPLLDLPTELLIEIFTLSDNPRISLVCHDFRDIVYSTPSFWSFIHIGPKQHTPEASQYLSKRLERGASSLLDVVIIDTEPASALSITLWQKLSAHRDRIRTFDVGTDTWILSGQIVNTVLLTPPGAPSILRSLIKLDVRHEDDLEVPYQRDPMEPHTVLRSLATSFPALTTLVLPFMLPCIPFLDSPILTLKTLVLDGSMSWICDYPSMRVVGQLLTNTPEVETFWCKDHRAHTHENLANLNSLPPDPWGCPVIRFPIILPKLKRMAVVVPGIGYDLLHVITAPVLQDLHMDGMRDDETYEEEVAWLDWFPGRLRTALQVTATRSPELRRFSLVGAYLSKDTLEWLLGCGPYTDDLPFPLLNSIAVHQMEAAKDEVANAIDEALIDLYVRQGRLVLRRFAYLASEPPLRAVALHPLMKSIRERQDPDHVFELEIDGTFVLDSEEHHHILTSQGVRVILHEEPPERKGWWTLGKDIDPTESDSY